MPKLHKWRICWYIFVIYLVAISRQNTLIYVGIEFPVAIIGSLHFRQPKSDHLCHTLRIEPPLKCVDHKNVISC